MATSRGYFAWVEACAVGGEAEGIRSHICAIKPPTATKTATTDRTTLMRDSLSADVAACAWISAASACRRAISPASRSFWAPNQAWTCATTLRPNRPRSIICRIASTPPFSAAIRSISRLPPSSRYFSQISGSSSRYFPMPPSAVGSITYGPTDRIVLGPCYPIPAGVSA